MVYDLEFRTLSMAMQKTESKARNLFKICLGFQGTCPVGVFLDFQMGLLR